MPTPKPKPTRYWNHRLVRVKDGGENILMLAEVHYQNEKPTGYVAARVFGDDVGECRMVIERMQKALAAPILDGDNWPNPV